MDPFWVVGSILGLVDPLDLLGNDPRSIERAHDAFPESPAMIVREPSIDARRALALVAAPGGLVLVAKTTVTEAPWARVGDIRGYGVGVRVTIRAESGSDEKTFSFDRPEDDSLLAWLNTPADRFASAARRIRRDAVEDRSA